MRLLLSLGKICSQEKRSEVDLNGAGKTDVLWCKVICPDLYSYAAVGFGPQSFFHERLPRHCRDFVEALPFHEYTHPHAGVLNIAAKLPKVTRTAPQAT